MKNPSKTVLLLALLALPVLASGCVAAIGNGQSPRSSGTLGQQLIDLQKARDAGAMTETEYQTERAKVLGRESR